MDIDFNINNYDLKDILNLFQVGDDFDEDDLKKSKKKVLMLHPDKSGLKKEYFLFFSKAYKILYQIFDFKKKGFKNMKDKYSDEYKDIVDDTKDIHNINNVFKNASEFSNWFNKTFDELKVYDDNNDNGYNNWLKENNEENNINISSTRQLHDEIENRKKNIKKLVPYTGIEETSANLSSGSYELDRSKQNYYGNSDIFSKLPYEDLKKAHTETLIPVNNEDYLNRRHYNSVQEYTNHRKENIEIFSKEESERILLNKKQSEEQHANKIAYQLLERQEKAEKNNDIFMSRLQRISYK